MGMLNLIRGLPIFHLRSGICSLPFALCSLPWKGRRRKGLHGEVDGCSMGLDVNYMLEAYYV